MKIITVTNRIIKLGINRKSEQNVIKQDEMFKIQ